MTECSCIASPFKDARFSSVDVGVDETHGRFGDVSILTCKQCESKWLKYFVEYEAFSKSGRWYRGLISDEVARSVTAETAVEALERLEWRFAGGSYFDSTGFRSTGAVHVGL